MSAEVFRFVTIRPPQQVDSGETTDTVVNLERSDSPLVDALRRARSTGSRPRVTSVAQGFVASADFIGSPRALDASVVQFIAALDGLDDREFWDGAADACKRIFGARPSSVVKSDAYLKATARTSDSIVAAAIDPSVPSKVRSLLVRVARALWLVRRLADDAPVSRRAFATAPLVLPGGIFPLPVADVDLRGVRAQQAKAAAAAVAARQQRLTQLAGDLTAYRQAADDVLTAFALDARPQSVAALPAATGATRAPAGFVLSDAAAGSLSAATKATFQKIGVSPERIDVARTITLFDKRAASAATQL